MKKAIIILISVGIVLAGLIIAVNHQKRNAAEGGNAADYSGTATSIVRAAAEDIFGGELYTVDDTYYPEGNCWIVCCKDRNKHDLDHMYYVFVDVETGAVLSAVRASEAEGSSNG